MRAKRARMLRKVALNTDALRGMKRRTFYRMLKRLWNEGRAHA